jgi:hypothetical protein
VHSATFDLELVLRPAESRIIAVVERSFGLLHHERILKLSENSYAAAPNQVRCVRRASVGFWRWGNSFERDTPR